MFDSFLQKKHPLNVGKPSARSAKIMLQLLVACVLLPLALFCSASTAFAQLVEYTWKPQYYNQTDESNKLTFVWKAQDIKITGGYMQEQGNLTIILGSNRGNLSIFENIADEENPNFQMTELRMSAWTEEPPEENTNSSKPTSKLLPMYFGARSAPTLFAKRQNEIMHILVGNAAGELFFVENRGTTLNPVFFLPYPRTHVIPEETLLNLNITNLVPSSCDINNDGITDLWIGSGDGSIYGFFGVNNGQGEAQFEEQPQIRLRLANGTNASPSCIEIGDDKTKSLLVGQKDGYLTLFENQGTEYEPQFSKSVFFYQNLDFGGENAPFFIKNQANQKFVFIGGHDNNVRRFTIRMFAQEPNLWSLQENLLNIEPLLALGKNLYITAGPLLGSDRPDLLIGSDAGNLTLYRNESTTTGVRLTKVSDNVLGNVMFEKTAPELGDLNGDGLLDLLLAEKSGRMHYFINNGTKTNPTFNIEVSDILDLNAFDEPTPRFLPNPQSGLLDIIISSKNQPPAYFKNTGTQNVPTFTQENLNYLFGDNPQPPFGQLAVFAWNQTTLPNLVQGNLDGTLQVFSHDPQITPQFGNTPLEFQSFLSQPFSVKEIPFIEELANIRPFFVDLLNRGKKDLFISNDQGDVLLFLQEKSTIKDPQLVYQEYRRQKLADIKNRLASQDRYRSKLVLPPVFRATKQNLIPQITGKRIAPDFGNLYGQNLADLVIGNADGSIEIYQNTGNQDQWEYQKTAQWQLPYSDKNAAPLIVDLFNRGVQDLVVGSRSGRIYYFQNTGSATKPNWVYKPEVFAQLSTAPNAIFSYLYSDPNNKTPDLIFSDNSGKLKIIRNQSTQTSISLRLENKNYLNLPFQNFPLAARIFDLNSDGSPEMVLTDDHGEFKVYQLSPDQKSWSQNLAFANSIRLPFGAIPAFAFLRGLGIVDMVVGFDDGRLELYRNDAISLQELEQMEEENLMLQENLLLN